MRLIDAEVVEAHLNDVINDKFVDADFKKACWGISIYLDTIPTIEAEPVKHGEWKEIITHNGCTPDYDCICSKCGRSGIAYYKYCPHCGAKMDLEDEENV